jgi:putative membrane protein
MDSGALPMKNFLQRAALALLLAACPLARAHVLTDAERSAPSFGWHFEPWVVVMMTVSATAYIAGYFRLQRRSGLGGRRTPAGPVSGARRVWLAAFAGGWITLIAALMSPLDTLSDALFSVHMVQHESLMLIAAPLLVLGRPLAVWIWALPRAARLWVGRTVHTRAVAGTWRMLTAPLVAWLLHAAALWAWHAPSLFEAALAHSVVHTLQHASFLATALLFWWAVLGDSARRQSGGHAMLSLFTTMVHTSALGALITLAPGLWYPSYIETCSALGVDPLHDQQLGGLIMWVPGAAAYLFGGLVVASRWLGHDDPSPVFTRRPGRVKDGVQ